MPLAQLGYPPRAGQAALAEIDALARVRTICAIQFRQGRHQFASIFWLRHLELARWAGLTTVPVSVCRRAARAVLILQTIDSYSGYLQSELCALQAGSPTFANPYADFG
jgi:hypothetical protein